MNRFVFERECRTPYSEAYTIFEDDRPVGRLDLHFAEGVIHATLCVSERLTQEAVQELLEAIDEELLDAVGIDRDEFIVHVYQGQEIAVYGDGDFGEDGREFS